MSDEEEQDELEELAEDMRRFGMGCHLWYFTIFDHPLIVSERTHEVIYKDWSIDDDD